MAVLGEPPDTMDLEAVEIRYENAGKTAGDDPWNFSADEDFRAVVVEDHPTEPYNPEEHGMATHEVSDLTKKDHENIAREKLGMSPADPGAIDLEGLEEHWGAHIPADIEALVVEVKALRGRVAELARQERAQYNLRTQRTAQLDAAEARVAALAGALEKFREHVLKHASVWEAEGGSHHHPVWSMVADVLAATAAEAQMNALNKKEKKDA